MIINDRGLTFRAVFQPKARRLWKIFSANPGEFHELMPSFDWLTSAEEVIATAFATDKDTIDCFIVELGNLGARFRYKMS